MRSSGRDATIVTIAKAGATDYPPGILECNYSGASPRAMRLPPKLGLVFSTNLGENPYLNLCGRFMDRDFKASHLGEAPCGSFLVLQIRGQK